MKPQFALIAAMGFLGVDAYAADGPVTEGQTGPATLTSDPNVRENAKDIERYWTKERMDTAKPAPVPRAIMPSEERKSPHPPASPDSDPPRSSGSWAPPAGPVKH